MCHPGVAYPEEPVEPKTEPLLSASGFCFPLEIVHHTFWIVMHPFHIRTWEYLEVSTGFLVGNWCLILAGIYFYEMKLSSISMLWFMIFFYWSQPFELFKVRKKKKALGHNTKIKNTMCTLEGLIVIIDPWAIMVVTQYPSEWQKMK